MRSGSSVLQRPLHGIERTYWSEERSIDYHETHESGVDGDVIGSMAIAWRIRLESLHLGGIEAGHGAHGPPLGDEVPERFPARRCGCLRRVVAALFLPAGRRGAAASPASAATGR